MDEAKFYEMVKEYDLIEEHLEKALKILDGAPLTQALKGNILWNTEDNYKTLELVISVRRGTLTYTDLEDALWRQRDEQDQFNYRYHCNYDNDHSDYYYNA